MTDRTTMLQSWVSEPENTARSVLVTIFGDTILPVGQSTWMAELFSLTEVFGFSGRLVRTSMFRLAAEGWLTNERVGRQSQYSLTTLAIEESEQAGKRIYHSPHPDWSGQWTVAFLATPSIGESLRHQLTQSLRWHGFVELGDGLLGSPTANVADTRELCRLIEPDERIPLAMLEFADLEHVVADGLFNESLAIDSLEKSYVEFVRFYEPVASGRPAVAPQTAFALRTMLIHDLRRIRLRSPDVPAALLPANWPGTDAHELAATLYPKLCVAAAPWLSEVLNRDYPLEFPNRFSGTGGAHKRHT